MKNVDQAASLIRDRLGELDNERKQLERALANLAGGTSRKRTGTRPRKRRARTKPPARRRRKGGTRAEHALAELRKSPGQTPSNLASRLGIKPNYMYRVVNQLEADGLIERKGKGYVPS
jgi:predicted Rossmann fold nucleotide-binding protein DprA/Smf involved in DNA uptake